MPRKWTIVLFAAFILLASGCGKSTKERVAEKQAKAETERVRVERERKRIEDLKRIEFFKIHVKAVLKDPDSAKFERLWLTADGMGMCGSVNAKNSYGGYVGFTDFVVTEEGAILHRPGLSQQQSDRYIAVLRSCTEAIKAKTSEAQAAKAACEASARDKRVTDAAQEGYVKKCLADAIGSS